MFQNLRELWQQAGNEARLGLVTGALLILAVVAYFGVTLMRPDYQTLFANLDAQDAAAMTAELDRMKVPYHLDNDGTTILVDKAQVHALRLKLLGKSGTVRSGVGFEIFNNTDFGMTEFAQKINYQRALQGELTRTIQALDEVKTARVHLVLPESGLFKKGGQKPKAAITLALKEGRSLAPEQVLGIQRLVAAAVPEIEPSAVTIADQRGVTLTRTAGTDGEEGMSGRLAIKSDVEAYFIRKLVHLFDKAFGPGRVIVGVDVTINHDQVKVTREDVIPLGTRGGESVGSLVRSRTTTTSGESGYVTAAAGNSAPERANGSSTSEVEYQNGRRVEQVVSMPGSIKRISVGVVLPNITDKARIEEIRHLVATTVGANPSRGDEIAISSLDLSSTLAPTAVAGIVKPIDPATIEQDVASNPAKETAAILSPREWLLLAVAGLVLLVLLAFVIGRRRQAPRRLTPQGREEVLAKVQGWLGEGSR